MIYSIAIKREVITQTAMEVDPDTRKKVLKALENPRYRWRTVRGIAAETHLEEDMVLWVLDDAEDVVKSAVPGPNGADLFTTRENYLKKANLFERIRSAVTNRLE